jgi:hypothetical protein
MRISHHRTTTVSTKVKKMLALAAVAAVAAAPSVALAGTAAHTPAGAHAGSHHVAINPQPLPPRGE